MEPFDALWLAATVRLAIPLLLAATGELISERAGVLNLGLEGMMLSGAFVGYWAAEGSGSITAGIMAAILAGGFGGLLMAAVAIGLRGDQVVVGIGLNILALGATNYALERAFPEGSLPIDRLDPIAIPVLSEIPWIGGALFEQNLLGYVAFLLIGAVALMLGRTGLGLEIRATGQNPSSASAAGVSPSSHTVGGDVDNGRLRRLGRRLPVRRLGRRLQRGHDLRTGLHRDRDPGVRPMEASGRTDWRTALRRSRRPPAETPGRVICAGVGVDADRHHRCTAVLAQSQTDRGGRATNPRPAGGSVCGLTRSSCDTS